MPENHRMPLTRVHASFVQFPKGNQDQFAPVLDVPIGLLERVAGSCAPRFRIENRVDLQERFASDVQQLVPKRGNSTPDSGKVKSMEVHETVHTARGSVLKDVPAANLRSEILVTA